MTTSQSDALLFLSQNASAVFGLLGALGGGVISFFAALHLKRREYDLQVRSKLLERQISAHEALLTLASEMRAMIAPGGVDSNGEVRRGPNVLWTKQDFENWFTRFSQLQLQGTTWQSVEAKREVAFVQDYLVTLHMHLAEVPDEKCFELGEAIRQDFIDMSSSLEKKAFSFFQSGIKSSRLHSLEAWHKYDISATRKRLQDMKLLQVIEQFKSRPTNAA